MAQGRWGVLLGVVALIGWGLPHSVAQTQVASPVLTPPPGGYAFCQGVFASCPATGAEMHFRLDSNPPTEGDPFIANGNGFLLNLPFTVSLRAFQSGQTPSAAVTGSYQIIGHIAEGADHVVISRTDGTVWTLGQNVRGQLGDGTLTARGSLNAVQGLTDVIGVAAGRQFSLALRNDGTLWAWGANDRGQLGDGTHVDRPVPVQVMGGVYTFSAGDSFAIVMRNDGTVWTWGANDRGQLGDGTTTDRSLPTQVSGLSTYSGVAAGSNFAFAVQNDGTVLAWGANDRGQLGDGTTIDRGLPGAVQGLSAVNFVAAGTAHALAVDAGGTVWTWGANGSGQLGDGASLDRSLPEALPGFPGVQSIAAGGDYSLVVKNDWSVWGWGDNSWGQIDASLGTSVPLPHAVAAVAQAKFAAGGLAQAAAFDLVGNVILWSGGTATTVMNLGDTDTDGNGLPDAWEIRNFGRIGNDPGADPDGDGLTNLQEYQQGGNPRNYYDRNGQIIVPSITLLGGDNQTSPPGDFAPQALSIRVTDGNGTPLANAPVTFSVTQGGGELALTVSGTPSTAVFQSLRTDASGQALVYFRQPATGGVTSQIAVAAGNASATFVETSLAPPAAPTNVQVTQNPDGSRTYTWQDNSDNETYFSIQEQQEDGTWLEVGRVSANQTTFTVPASTP